ncbi:hypothetical protein PENTCL1PPCAC_7321, partial [Pristionchus entomophagus]
SKDMLVAQENDLQYSIKKKKVFEWNKDGQHQAVFNWDGHPERRVEYWANDEEDVFHDTEDEMGEDSPSIRSLQMRLKEALKREEQLEQLLVSSHSTAIRLQSTRDETMEEKGRLQRQLEESTREVEAVKKRAESAEAELSLRDEKSAHELEEKFIELQHRYGDMRKKVKTLEAESEEWKRKEDEWKKEKKEWEWN